MSADDKLERPKSVQAAFEVYQGKPDTGPHATALFAYIEALEAERDEAKRRLAEEFANMDATMKGWDRLCEQSEADASALEAYEAKIAALTAENATLRETVERSAEDERDRLFKKLSVAPRHFEVSYATGLLKLEGAMLPSARAALRQEGKP